MVFNPFHPTGLFLYTLKKSENQRISDVFRRYRKRPVACSGLNNDCLKGKKCDALRNVVPFVQFKTRKKTPEECYF